MSITLDVAPVSLVNGSNAGQNCGSSANRVILISEFSSSGNPTAPTVNGVSCTQINSTFTCNGPTIPANLWYLIAPASGSQTIVLNNSNLGGYYLVLAGADQTSPIDSSNVLSQHAGTTHSLAVTVSASNCWLIGTGSGSQNITSVGGDFTVNSGLGPSMAYSNGTIGTGSQTGTWGTDSGTFGFALAAIAPSAAVTATTSNYRALLGVGI